MGYQPRRRVLRCSLQRTSSASALQVTVRSALMCPLSGHALMQLHIVQMRVSTLRMGFHTKLMGAHEAGGHQHGAHPRAQAGRRGWRAC